ncbi:unnamed protein product [Amoebophrya sp. A120]|nr:unnamed protein product [Amoebophrya sp. A120]|eukprot:GSA120T00001706001.1
MPQKPAGSSSSSSSGMRMSAAQARLVNQLWQGNVPSGFASMFQKPSMLQYEGEELQFQIQLRASLRAEKLTKAEKQQIRDKCNEHCSLAGMRLLNCIKSDGNCFFYGLDVVLNGYRFRNDFDRAAKLRKELCDVLRRMWNDPSISSPTLQDKFPFDTLASITDDMAQDGNYANHFMMLAAQYRFNIVEIRLFSNFHPLPTIHTNYLPRYPGEPIRECVNLAYTGKRLDDSDSAGLHYDLVAPVEKQPDEIFPVPTNEPADHRDAQVPQAAAMASESGAGTAVAGAAPAAGVPAIQGNVEADITGAAGAATASSSSALKLNSPVREQAQGQAEAETRLLPPLMQALIDEFIVYEKNSEPTSKLEQQTRFAKQVIEPLEKNDQLVLLKLLRDDWEKSVLVWAKKKVLLEEWKKWMANDHHVDQDLGGQEHDKEEPSVENSGINQHPPHRENPTGSGRAAGADVFNIITDTSDPDPERTVGGDSVRKPEVEKKGQVGLEAKIDNLASQNVPMTGGKLHTERKIKAQETLLPTISEGDEDEKADEEADKGKIRSTAAPGETLDPEHVTTSGGNTGIVVPVLEYEDDHLNGYGSGSAQGESGLLQNNKNLLVHDDDQQGDASARAAAEPGVDQRHQHEEGGPVVQGPKQKLPDDAGKSKRAVGEDEEDGNAVLQGDHDGAAGGGEKNMKLNMKKEKKAIPHLGHEEKLLAPPDSSNHVSTALSMPNENVNDHEKVDIVAAAGAPAQSQKPSGKKATKRTKDDAFSDFDLNLQQNTTGKIAKKTSKKKAENKQVQEAEKEQSEEEMKIMDKEGPNGIKQKKSRGASASGKDAASVGTGMKKYGTKAPTATAGTETAGTKGKVKLVAKEVNKQAIGSTNMAASGSSLGKNPLSTSSASANTNPPATAKAKAKPNKPPKPSKMMIMKKAASAKKVKVLPVKKPTPMAKKAAAAGKNNARTKSAQSKANTKNSEKKSEGKAKAKGLPADGQLQMEKAVKKTGAKEKKSTKNNNAASNCSSAASVPASKSSSSGKANHNQKKKK